MADKGTIGVIGAGVMGRGIAQIFAVHGFSVRLMDVQSDSLQAVPDQMRAALTLMAANGIGNTAEIEPAIRRVHCTTSLTEAASRVNFVVEAVFEKLDLKQKVFQELDSVCGADTILATNTSVISITEIAAKAVHRHRIVGTHFWMPPYLIPLVEVVKGRDTSEEVMAATFALLKSVGKHPVRVNKDVPGFVANRLQHALWREAISIVERGIADPATVDECIRYGFGLRLPCLGPMENADMAGTDLTLSIHSYILKHLESSPEPSPLLKSIVEQNRFGFKTGKGFQEWTPEQVEQSKTRLTEYLIGAVKNLSGG